MRKQMLMTLTIIAFLGWSCLFFGSAHAAVIGHLDPNTGTPVTSNPTITILIQDSTGAYSDKTGTWLPEPGQTVMIQVNNGGAAVSSPVLSAWTSYPGICTNFLGTDNPNAPGPDFTLSGNQLTSNDCGGTATIQVIDSAGLQYFFKVPQDSNNNGIPDVWENQYGGNLVATDDSELPPPNGSTEPNPTITGCPDSCRKGDGIAAFDEYRGFIVSSFNTPTGSFDTSALQANTKHIRTNPSQKDLFVHVVNNPGPDCVPSSSATNVGTFARYFPAGGPDMFAALYTMVSNTQFHFLDYMPYTPGLPPNPKKSTLWEDYFYSYNVTTDPDGDGPLLQGVLFLTPANVYSNTDADVPTDRQINKYAVYPVSHDSTLSTIQKGVRLIECQVVDTLTTLGWGDWGTPNKQGSTIVIHAGNAVVFPERIRNSVQTKLKNAGSGQISWRTYDPKTTTWVTQTQPALNPNQNQGTQDFLTTKQIQFLVGMEIGHSAQLRPTSTNGYHTTTDSGSEMDAQIYLTSSSKKTTFDIPSQFWTSDQIETRFKN
jgi:hypothetical protein